MEIENLFKSLENKELKELIKQIEQLTKQQMDKDKMNEGLKNLQMKNDEL